MPNALDFFLDNTAAAGNIQHTQAETQQALANTNLLTMQAQQMQGNRQAIQDAVLASQNAPQAQAGTTPNTNAAGVPLDQTSGQPKVTGINANPDMMNLNQTISGLQQQQKMAQSIMASPQNVSPAMRQQYQEIYQKASQDIAAAQEKQLTLKNNLVTQLGGVAGAAANDPDVKNGVPGSFDAYHQQMDALAPGYLNGKDVDHDIMGNIIEGPRTAKVLDSLAQASMPYQEQLARQAANTTAQARLAAAGESTLREQLAEKEFDAKQAAAQNKVDLQSGPPAIKPPPIKVPTAPEVNNWGQSLANQYNLKLADGKAAAQDMLETRNALIAKGADPVVAQSQAQAAIAAKIQAGTPATTTPGMLYGTNTTPAKFGTYPKPAQATPAPAAAAPAAKAAAPAIPAEGTTGSFGGKPVKVVGGKWQYQ